MGWASLSNTGWPTNNDILDAISLGILVLRPGQTVSANNNYITVSEANTKLQIETLAGPGTRWPTKIEFISDIVYLEPEWEPSGPYCETV